MGFDTLWFAMLFMVNMQMAYLTPALRLQFVLHEIDYPQRDYHGRYLQIRTALRRPANRYLDSCDDFSATGVVAARPAEIGTS